MLNNLLLVIELTAITVLSAVIFFDLAATKRRPSPVKVPVRNIRRGR